MYNSDPISTLSIQNVLVFQSRECLTCFRHEAAIRDLRE